jgi:hypothetical protein
MRVGARIRHSRLNQENGMTTRLGIAAGLFVALVATASAQWLNHRDPTLPRTADGRPNLTAPPPRLADGRVDFSGVWMPDWTITQGAAPVGQTSGEDPVIRLLTEDGTPYPLLPAAAAEYKERLSRGDQGPSSRCMPHTIVDAYLVPEPIKIVHTPRLTILLQEEYQHFRQIFTDGRGFPADMQPAWYGYSIGRWEGQEFVVETAGFNDRGWLDVTPLIHSETLRITERFRRPNVGTLQMQATINDPSKFSRVWRTQTISFRLQAEADLVEYLCDNNTMPKLTGTAR